MTTKDLYKELDYVNHSREKRLHYANLVVENPSLIPKLLDILFQVDDKTSPKAAWILEFTFSKNLELIIPHLNRFTTHIDKIYLDSAVRPIAKICEYLITAYYLKKENKISQALKPKFKEKITETCFDWMISEQKVAPKAYAMNSLYLLGQDYNWIHEDLALILERDYQIQSAAFKARARQILKKIKKNKETKDKR